MALAPATVQAQSEGQAFSCDGTFYQVRQIGTGASAYSALYVVNRSTAVYTTNAYTFGGTSTTGSLGVVVNALAYNPQDSYLYAITYPADNGTPNAATGIHLYRIGRGGIQDLGQTNLPLAQYNSGTIDKQGNFYLTTRNSAGLYLNTLFRLKLSDFSTVLTSHDELPLVTSNGTTAATADFTDIAYSPTTNSIYGSSELNDLLKIVVTTVGGVEKGVLTTIASGNTTGEIVGSNFFDVAGNLYTYSNSGGIYSVDVNDGTSTLISTVDAASNSDGASCINPSERIDVVKELTGVTYSTNGATNNSRQDFYDVSFAIRVKNTGTTTTTNVQVSDYLNNTFGTAAYSILTAPVVTNYSINNGAVPTLAVNTAFNGSGTNADLLTGNQQLTAGQSALITFTVRLTFSGRTPVIPTTPYNNYAYASTTSGTAVNQGHVRLSDGSVIPPGNLLAQDQSTNSAGLPTTANGDTPSPTPIRLTTAIFGTVFEDVNYGGGAGRSQGTSNGQGIPDVRVELYSPTGTFIRTVFTDASGNYEFTVAGGTTPLSANTAYQVRVVNSTVGSTRPNLFNNVIAGVQTYINGATNLVGGANPNLVDVGTNSGGTTLLLLESQSTTTTIQSLTTATTPASGPLTNVDFGFNFDVITNTNDSGPGSFRQFVTNSNELGNTGLAQEGLTAGLETSIFMLNNGVANTNGLRSTVTVPGYNATTKAFTINLTTATQMWMYSSNTVIDGKQQSIRTGDVAATASSTSPEVIINFANQQGIYVTGANTRIASMGLNNAKGTSTTTASLDPLQGAAVTFSGAAATGSVFTDNTTSGNATAGVRLQGGATGITISNNVLSNGASTAGSGTVTATDGGGIVLSTASTNSITGNTILSNAGFGIEFQNTGANDGNTVTGNTISTNGGGTATTNRAGIAIRRGNNNLFSTNTLSSNVGDAILAFNGTSGNRFSRNSMFSNGTGRASDGTAKIGIDLMASGASSNGGDDVSLNADGKSSTSGANGLLNFPVITQAAQDGTNLRITGYAPLDATIEFFVADMTTSPSFGEGRYYLATRKENLTGEDFDTKSTAYSGTINGQNSGSESAARRFAFIIPLSSLGTTERAALVAASARITATASFPTTVNTLLVGNTSEFSGNAPVLAGVLPVELTAFTAQAVGQSAQLTWTTASEKANDHFVVERAYGEQAFTPIATVKGAGTSVQAHSYSFTDAGIGTKNLGTIYYRLKQVDTNGSEVQAGPVRTLTFGGAKEATASVYPNPAANDAQLDLTSLPAGSYQVSIVDATGRTLATRTYEGGTLHPFAVRSLTSGSYLVVIRGNNVKITQRLVKN
ncbi:beta strand repeat-containing protein [Hymenobacter chitinivorans]|uniref:beta strand repeat-containing protein n=1 Tax=Hymenobacter chitinivorans TaxID=89969 RepID=UPI00147672C3|nr:T9SS type A sorting domain-containing protein [Hymenobacter chitinivorans]